MVSTPYMDEASLCDRIALIQKGEILAIDSPPSIINAYPKSLYEVKGDNFYQLLQDLRTASFIDRVEPFGEFLHVSATAPLDLQEVDRFMQEKGHDNYFLREAKANIEDVFLDLM